VERPGWLADSWASESLLFLAAGCYAHQSPSFQLIETTLGRQRPPIPCQLPFSYWVFGRPVSTQNDDGSKPGALPAWRDKVNSALGAAVAMASKNRGFELVQDLVEVRVIWLSADPADRQQPDVDNMLKPLIDAFNEKIIGDDRQVHRILAEKANIELPPHATRGVYPEIQDDEEYAKTGEVVVVFLNHFNREYHP
jgi:Holliday junction resolvase RusA-like endonuclease